MLRAAEPPTLMGSGSATPVALGQSFAVGFGRLDAGLVQQSSLQVPRVRTAANGLSGPPTSVVLGIEVQRVAPRRSGGWRQCYAGHRRARHRLPMKSRLGHARRSG